MRDRRKVILLSLVGFGFISLLIIQYILSRNKLTYNSKADATQTVSLKFDPTAVTATTNNEYTVVIKGKTTNQINIQGYNFGLAFDKTRVQITEVSYKFGTVSIGLGDDTSNVAAINSAGYIKVHGQIEDAAGRSLGTTDTDIVSIKFKFIGNTDTSISLGTVTAPKFFYISGADGALASYPTSLDVLTITASGGSTTNPTGTTTITSVPGTSNVTLNLKLKFQGIQKKPAAALDQLNVKVTLLSGDNRRYTSTNRFTSDDSGVWSGSVTFSDAQINQKYKIYVKGEKHIAKRICDSIPTETYPGTYQCNTTSWITLTTANTSFDFSKIYMLTGDLPTQDGIVDSYDASLIRNNLGKSDNRACDLNLDGICDTQDWSLMIAALSIRSDDQ